jgi:hypothetical protein
MNSRKNVTWREFIVALDTRRSVLKRNTNREGREEREGIEI